MANTTTIKRRINSIKNTRQITKAMEMVASSKLRRAQNQAETTREYRQVAYRLLAHLSRVREVGQHPLFKKRPVKSKLYVIITSNSGLAGAYNANVFKTLTTSIKKDRAKNIESRVVTIGTKGVQFVRQISGVELEAHYPNFGDNPTEGDIRPILDYIVEQYDKQKTDKVELIYTEFKSSINQVATKLSLLPASLEAKDDDIKTEELPELDMNFEPDVETVIHFAAARLIQAQIWQALLESLASEYAMRMLAMKNATDNANDLIEDYTLVYNTARQSAITQELAEISGGAEALSDN